MFKMKTYKITVDSIISIQAQTKGKISGQDWGVSTHKQSQKMNTNDWIIHKLWNIEKK
jgi:hypothetical protein